MGNTVLSERDQFLLEFEKALSSSETLYQKIMNMIKSKNISMNEFYDETKISRNILKDIKTKNKRPSLKTVISICIGLHLETIESYKLIHLAGYELSDTILLDRAYSELISHYNDCGIKDCNARLRELGFEKESELLGTQQRV